MPESVIYTYIVFAGIIAHVGYNTKYRYIGIAIFLEFIFMGAYEAYILDPVYGHTYTTYREVAPFYGYKLLLQSIFTMAYIHLNCKSLTVISIIIMSVLTASIGISLYNVNVIYYEGIMLALSTCQLIAGYAGVSGGYINILNSIRGSVARIFSKGIYK